MAEEAIPFILIFVPLALALGYDSIVGVSIPFVGSQVGFRRRLHQPVSTSASPRASPASRWFSGMGYRIIVWAIATLVTIAFMMWYAARIKRHPQSSPTWALDEVKRTESTGDAFSHLDERAATAAVLALFVGSLAVMVVGVVYYKWDIDQIGALFLTMAIVIGVVGKLDPDTFVARLFAGRAPTWCPPRW